MESALEFTNELFESFYLYFHNFLSDTSFKIMVSYNPKQLLFPIENIIVLASIKKLPNSILIVGKF